MRVWLRRKHKPTALHELNEYGTDTVCYAVQLKGMNINRYYRIGKPNKNERVCQACQFAIAERRGKF